MSDLFYSTIRCIGRRIFWLSSRPLVLHASRLPQRGPFLLVANHSSPFDVPLLIRQSDAHLDFVSTTEVFSHRFSAWFYGSMNAFPLDRRHRDPATVRVILQRLKNGRAVAFFPEGQLNRGASSMVHGGKWKRGFGRIAQLAAAPIVPAVSINSAAYYRIRAWLPLRQVRYGLIFGQPIMPPGDVDSTEAADKLEAQTQASMAALHKELAQAMREKFGGDYE